MLQSFQKIAGYFGDAFSENGTPSASRLLTIPHVLASTFVLVYVTIKNHAIPDATVLTGLGVFSTVHYAVNKASSVIQAFSNNPTVPNPNQTPAPMGNGK
jgi:hypothetical protein